VNWVLMGKILGLIQLFSEALARQFCWESD
jgi:hypothetical protein